MVGERKGKERGDDEDFFAQVVAAECDEIAEGGERDGGEGEAGPEKGAFRGDAGGTRPEEVFAVEMTDYVRAEDDFGGGEGDQGYSEESRAAPNRKAARESLGRFEWGGLRSRNHQEKEHGGPPSAEKGRNYLLMRRSINSERGS